MNHNKNSSVRLKTTRIIQKVEQANDKLDEVQRRGAEFDTAIENEFKPFDYREVIPVLYETILSNLPNKIHHPEQAKLYDAFANHDVKGIMETPRNQRKQIFVTGMTAYFTYDLAAGQFGQADTWRKSRGMPGGDMEGMEDEYMYEMMMEEEYGMDMGEFGLPGAFGTQTAEEKESGFVVTLVCYSPYGDNIAELGTLIDPFGVEDRPDKWGFATRLAHLDDYVEDGNSPFELYEKTVVPEQFSLEIKKVIVEEQMPGGIGVQEVRYNTAGGVPKPGDPGVLALIDPLTKEIMNEISVLDEKGKPAYYQGKEVKQVNDHWFVLNIKLIWRDAPEAPEQPGMGGMMGGMMGGTMGRPGMR
jgi:hypothetical protein